MGASYQQLLHSGEKNHGHLSARGLYHDTGQKGFWTKLILIEIVVALTATVLPVGYTLFLLIIFPIFSVFYVKPILGLLCVIPTLPNILIKFYSIGPADITPLEVSLFLAVMSFIFLCIREKRMVIHGSGNDVAIFLLVSWCLLTLFWAPSTDRGIYQIIKMIPGLTLYYLHLQFVRSKKDFGLLLSAWIVMAMFFTMVGFFETIFYGMEAAGRIADTGRIAHLTRAVRANVFFKSPDDLGFVLSISILVAIAKYTTTESKRWKLLLLIFLPMMMFVLLATFSRKSILAVFVSCFYLSTQNKKIFKSFVAASVLGFILLAVMGSTGFLETLARRLESYFMDPEIAISSRMQLWSLGLELFSASPVIGNGLGSFFLASTSHGGQYGSVHNFYLFVLCELGLVGFLLTMLWGLQIGGRFYQFFRVNKDEANRLLGQTIVGGFIVLGITGFFRAMNLIDPIFWGFLGLASAFLKVYFPQERQRS
jgi:O-antigen ligase